MGFHIAVTILFRVEVRGIGRQPFHRECGMGCQRRRDFPCFMCPGTIPNQNEPSWEVSLEVLERRNDALCGDRPSEMALVNLARQGQSDRRRKLAPRASAPADDRGPSLRSPGAAQGFLKREPELVEQHDVGVEAPSLFFLRGQSCRNHAATNASSRSRARSMGYWQRQPHFLSKALTECTW